MKSFDLKKTCKNLLPNPQVIAWAEANDLDPKSIPVDQVVLINEDEKTMTLAIFHPDGNRILENGLREKQTVTVPLVSAPEAFGF